MVGFKNVDNDAVLSDYIMVVRERDAAHAALRQIADSLGNGAFVGAECSPEFHCMVADEVAAVVARLTGERDAANTMRSDIVETGFRIAAERDAARYELEAEREECNQIVAAMNQAEDERDAARDELSEQIGVTYELRAELTKAESERGAALDLAYIGEHRFPDLTYKARLEECVTDLRKAESERDAARAELVRLQWSHYGPCGLKQCPRCFGYSTEYSADSGLTRGHKANCLLAEASALGKR